MALKILFSPSESKISLNTNNKFNGKDLIFPELFDKRVEILNKYDLKESFEKRLSFFIGINHLILKETIDTM